MSARLLTERGGQGGVHHRVRPLDCAECGKVDDVEVRVGWSFGHHQHGLSWFHCCGKFARVAPIHIRDVDAHSLARTIEECQGSAVAVALRDDVITSRTQGKDGGGNRAHTRAERERSFRSFQLGDCLLE